MSKDKARRYNNWDDDDEQQDIYDDDEQDVYDELPRPRRPPAARPRRRRRKQRRVWPWLLAGCVGGIIILVLAAAIVVFLALRTATNGGNLGSIGGIANPTTYTQQSSPQPLQLANITQMNIHDPIGNITITVDPTATQSTLTTVKKVKANSSDAANKEFGNVAVQVQPPGTAPNTLAVSATVPDAGGILGNHNDSVDLTIILPSVIGQASNTSTPLTLTADTSIGDVTVNGLNGVLGIKDNIGNITVNNATLFDGSHLETGTGNVVFSGSLNLTPSAGNTTPRFKLQCESGQINVTLPADTNIILDANTNAGAITSDFPINVQSSGGAANYYGPLISGSTQGPPQAVLTLNVSTGQVTIHKM